MKSEVDRTSRRKARRPTPVRKSTLATTVMIDKARPSASVVGATSCRLARGAVMTFNPAVMEGVLGRLAVDSGRTQKLLPHPVHDCALPAPTVDRLSTAIGCTTPEMASTLLGQLLRLEHLSDSATRDDLNVAMKTAAASIGELRPKTAIEAMLATQIVGTHRLAMTFLAKADDPGQMDVDAQVMRTARLLRLFQQQVELFEKFKGNSAPQSLVVGHVNVESGGSAVVGLISTGVGSHEKNGQ